MTRSAPRAIGRCRHGLANVLSIAHTTPAFLHDAATARMSMQRRVGLIGDSNQTRRVFGLTIDAISAMASIGTKRPVLDEILNRLRGQDAELFTRAVDILVSRLRKKLEPLEALKTLRNAGYCFALPELAP